MSAKKPHAMHEEKPEILEEDEEMVVEEDEGNAEGRMRKLRDELLRCRKEKDEYLDGWQRARADYVNVRKEEEEKLRHIAEFAEEEFIRDILEVVSNFDRAFAGLDKSNTYVQGFSHIYTQLLKILEGKGVVPIPPAEGTPFDAAFHDALERVDVGDQARDGMVEKELERGYVIRGKVLKPSKVRVTVYKKEE